MVCSKHVCVWKMVHDKVACEKVVCVCARERWCVCDTVVRDKDMCDKVVWQRCVLKMVHDNDVGV